MINRAKLLKIDPNGKIFSTSNPQTNQCIELCLASVDDGDWAKIVPETVHLLHTHVSIDLCGKEGGLG